MSYSSRFWLYAPTGLFLALAAGAMIHWWLVAGAFDKKLDALNGHEAVPGITLSYSAKTISGFPFNLDVVFQDFRVSGQGAHGPFSWSSEHFALHALTYGRTQYIYEAAGRQSLRWTDSKGILHRLDFLPGSLRASAIGDGKGLSRFDLDLIGAEGKNEKNEAVTIGRAQFHLRRDPKADALDLMVSLDGAQTPSFSTQSLRAFTTLDRRDLLAPLLAGTRSWPATDAAWKNAGGSAKDSPGPAAASDLLNPLF